MSVSERYFKWICHVAMNGDADQHQRLLHYLFEKNYRYTHPRDENREADGIDLRYRFGYLHGIPLAEITYDLDFKPCSVLEMMVALAIRCEENILRNFEIGDRTYEWFRDMLDSLGIFQNDSEFNVLYVDSVIERFLDRDYAPDGSGGLFRLSNPYDDMRHVEIWCQAMWWISEKMNI